MNTGIQRIAYVLNVVYFFFCVLNQDKRLQKRNFKKKKKIIQLQSATVTHNTMIIYILYMYVICIYTPWAHFYSSSVMGSMTLIVMMSWGLWEINSSPSALGAL